MSRKTRLGMALAIIAALVLTSCNFSNQGILVRSDMPIDGMDYSLNYRLESNPEGTSEVNEIVLQGMNQVSPVPVLETKFTKVSDTVRSQTVKVTEPDGKQSFALGMQHTKRNFGLTEYLEVSTATYQMQDSQGQLRCGAKVRMDFKPNGAQLLSSDKNKGWDAIWYYLVPCAGSEAGDFSFSVDDAEFYGLVITEQWAPRITGKPLLFNRGRSVTVVGGIPATYPAGWWLKNASDNGYSVLDAEKLVRDMVNDLDTSQNPWLEFSKNGQFRGSDLVYSAADADAFLTFERAFLNRQTDYVVNYRTSANAAWRPVIVHPVYNYEWNDVSQNLQATQGINPLAIDDRLNEFGLPKDPNDEVIKEIETYGCQNCPNPTLEQIQLLDGNSGEILYAMTLRGYIGAKNSLVMFGDVPEEGTLDEELARASTNAGRAGYQNCPARYNENGERLPSSEQISEQDCAEMLREGAMWQYLTESADSFGFDLVSQYNVRDNGTWAQECSGSGESTSCWLVPVERKLEAIYMFNERDTTVPWTVFQMLGEVGVRTLGLSYASQAYAGNGILFAMGQNAIYNQWKNGIGSDESVFMLDARAMQLPDTIETADGFMR